MGAPGIHYVPPDPPWSIFSFVGFIRSCSAGAVQYIRTPPFSFTMDREYPPPRYSNTVPARPRLQIPMSRSNLPSKPLSAPANHPEKLMVTPASTLMTSTNISPSAMPEPDIHPIYNQSAGTWTYLVADPVTEQAIVIDLLLDYDQSSNVISTKSADKLLDLILTEGYTITLILETRLHRSHISASYYLQSRLNDLSTVKARICIGSAIAHCQAANRLSKDVSNEQDEGYFDHLFRDYEQFRIGNIIADVVRLPFADAPENVGYIIGINVFTTIYAIATSRTAAKGSSNDDTVTSPASAHFSVTSDRDEPSEGWQRLMNLPTLCRVYGSTEHKASQPYLTYEEMRALHDRMGAETTAPAHGEGKEATMELYATQINVRAGRIPAKINMILGEEGKGDSGMPDPLKIPKKLAELVC